MGETEEPWWRNYTVEELEAMVDEAHAVGKKVAAHCSGVTGILNAVEAGIDTIEHCNHIDELEPKKFEETIETIKRKKLIIDPTLSIGWANTQARLKDGSTPAYAIRKAKADEPHRLKSFMMLYHSGVKIASGSDTSGRHPWLRHGDNAIELELRVEAGMSPMDAIVSATKNSAECAGIQDITGIIEEGKMADIIVIDGDPLKNINILREKDRLHLVMKEGQPYINVTRG